MPEWISWIYIMRIVPSIPHIQFLRKLDSVVDTRVLFTCEKLLIFFSRISHWQFSTRINISIQYICKGLSHPLSRVKVDNNCINVLIPWFSNSYSRCAQNDNCLLTLCLVVPAPSGHSVCLLFIKLWLYAISSFEVSKDDGRVILFLLDLDDSRFFDIIKFTTSEDTVVICFVANFNFL